MTLTATTDSILRRGRRPRTAPSNAPPPLVDGDRLSGAEFERRYAATPEGIKAELIEGIVYMAPPCFEEDHGAPHGKVVVWLGTYSASTPGTVLSDNSSLRLDPANRPQPDAYLRIFDTHGGRTRVAADGYVEGAPDLIVEVAASSAGRDLGDKLNVYRRNGVREYLVWRTLVHQLDWFLLGPRRNARLHASRPGIFKSRAFPGLWLDAPALLRGDLAAVLRVVRDGVASREHADFVARLDRAAARRK